VALARSDWLGGVRPPYDAVLMFRLLVLQTLYTLSDDQTEYQVRDRLSFMRFVGLGLGDPVPDAKTLWLFREQLTRAGAIERLFARFDRLLRDAGYLAPRRSADRRCFADGACALLRLGGQIVDATVVQARRPRLKGDEKAAIKEGKVPEDWSKAKTAQMDRDGRWTLKRGRKRPPKGNERVATELVVPAFGYENHVTIDRRHGFVRRHTVTDAAAHDGAQLGAVLDPDNTASTVWADTAYRSKVNLDLLVARGMTERLQRPKPRGRPMPKHVRRGNATRAKVRARVEHVFAAQKRRLGLVVRTVGKARASAKLGLANLVTNMLRFVWFEARPAPT
jgi:transposase, IS5 family